MREVTYILKLTIEKNRVVEQGENLDVYFLAAKFRVEKQC